MANPYKDTIDAMTWSYSRLSAFAQCKYLFYLRYIVNDDDQYLAEGNYYAEVGSFVHRILEMVLKNELSVEEAGTYFADHFDENVFYKTRKSIMDSRYEACARYFSDLDFTPLIPYEILAVEQRVDIEIEGYSFTGYIDLLLRERETGDILLVDHKSSRYPLSKKTGKPLKTSEPTFASHKRQLLLYSLYVLREYGQYPAKLIWNHFQDGAVVSIPFCEAELTEAKQWFLDTLRSVEAEEAYEPTQDFFFCHNLCEYRHSCEYAQ